MEIANLEDRITRAEKVLTEVAQGNFDLNIDLDGSQDALTSLEMGINFMIMDLRTMVEDLEKKELSLLSKHRELEEKIETIGKQAAAIKELSTPVMEVWEDVLVLPIVGVVDTRRSIEIMDNLLEKIVESQSRCIIIDITGVEIVDTRTADYLLKVVQAAQLLGSRCVLTGINPAVAQTLVEIGADLSMVKTLRNLRAGLFDCIQYLNSKKRTKLTRPND